jgi:hypothetical protein
MNTTKINIISTLVTSVAAVFVLDIHTITTPIITL